MPRNIDQAEGIEALVSNNIGEAKVTPMLLEKENSGNSGNSGGENSGGDGKGNKSERRLIGTTEQGEPLSPLGNLITPYNSKNEGAENVLEVNQSIIGDREDSVYPLDVLNSPENNVEGAGKTANPQDNEK